LALDRQTIEKRDFPIGRRGYEPVAVDAHLAAIAREVEALKRARSAAPAEAQSSSGGASLAAVASAQVQAIAREHGEQVAEDAAREAQRIHDEAIERSQEHVGKVHEATALMLQRVDAMESELSSLVESLRTGANRLNADLSLLSGNMSELYAAAGDSREAGAVPAPEVVVEEVAADDQGNAAAAPAEDGDDVEGARLIALNMALNGQSREETDKYLAENFDLSDRSALLDEVYATVEG
jgi:hypothetical protein